MSDQFPNQAAVSEMNARPLVSVCIHTYQHVNYIKQCLDSVLEQKTDFPFEILLGEDASTDGTREICIEYAERFPDSIRLFLHDRKNVIYIFGKPTGRFNLLNNLKEARGKYIARCDGDDFWQDETKLQQQVDFLEQNDDHVLCFHRAQVVDSDGQPVIPHEFVPRRCESLSQQELVIGCYVQPLTVLFRKPPNFEFPEAIRQVFNADTFMFSLLGQFGRGGFLSGIKDAKYRRHDGGTWTTETVLRKKAARIDTFEHVIDSLSDPYKQICIAKVCKLHYSQLKYLLLNFQLREYAKAYQKYVAFRRKHHLPITYALATQFKRLISKLWLFRRVANRQP